MFYILVCFNQLNCLLMCIDLWVHIKLTFLSKKIVAQKVLVNYLKKDIVPIRCKSN